MSGASRTAVVTGGNRGLGLEVGAQLAELGYRVLLTGRNLEATEAAAAAIGGAAMPLDVADPAEVDRFVRSLRKAGVVPDVLVNNAGVCPDEGPLDIPEERLGELMATNLYGPWLLMRGFVPGMVGKGHGRVVNVSSENGSFGAGGPSGGAYGLSKAALNALTVTVAAQVPHGVDVLVNAVDPGWCRTDMGGPQAPRSVVEGVASIVAAATLPEGGPHGAFLRDGAPFPW